MQLCTAICADNAKHVTANHAPHVCASTDIKHGARRLYALASAVYPFYQQKKPWACVSAFAQARARLNA